MTRETERTPSFMLNLKYTCLSCCQENACVIKSSLFYGVYMSIHFPKGGVWKIRELFTKSIQRHRCLTSVTVAFYDLLWYIHMRAILTLPLESVTPLEHSLLLYYHALTFMVGVTHTCQATLYTSEMCGTTVILWNQWLNQCVHLGWLPMTFIPLSNWLTVYRRSSFHRLPYTHHPL